MNRSAMLRAMPEVMGGKSTGSFAESGGVGVFEGEVVDVPALKAPGFIKAAVVDMQPGHGSASCEPLRTQRGGGKSQP